MDKLTRYRITPVGVAKDKYGEWARFEDVRKLLTGGSLFDAIKHGDDKHQLWLKEAIDKWALAHLEGR